MKVTYSWLKDFVDLKITPHQLADKLTMAGLEVVSLEESGQDFVFEIEITSNRSDWLSVLGIAREVGAICGLKPKVIKQKETKAKIKDVLPLKILVEDKKDCPYYSARIISNIKVGPSPDWLKKRLESLGCRSVNNIVDITNYILFETGQPLHAFDLDVLGVNVVNIRRAKNNEKIVTIDGQEKILTPEVLVIADLHQPVAVAGIMGGKNSEVTFKTRNILLESAVFNPILVRRAKQKLGLQSESAYRFERGVDLTTAQSASLAAQELILKLASGKLCGFKSVGTSKQSLCVINLEIAAVHKTLGVNISLVKIKQILISLGLSVKVKSKKALTVTVPSFRQDLKLPVDLIEEIARIYGYAQIPTTMPAIRPGEDIVDKKNITAQVKNILSGLGMAEVITYSLVDRALLNKAGVACQEGLLEILNPLSLEQEVLRPALFPSLVRCLAYNLNQQQENIKIFEIADVFSDQGGSVQERPCLALALSGVNSFLIRQGLVKDEVTLLHLKGILEILFSRLGIKNFDFSRYDDNRINIIINSEVVGFMLELSQKITQIFDIKNRQVILAQVDLQKLSSHVNLGKKFLNLPKFPSITRDISFVMKNDLAIKDLLLAIEEKGAPLLRQAKVADYYQGKQIPPGFKGLTISCIYRQDERTLTEDEISPLHNQICALLKERFEINFR
ncbi:MAG: phenylalanine--tRNA ligase subunit beta [Candidatus Omnitrophota bacterium]